MIEGAEIHPGGVHPVLLQPLLVGFDDPVNGQDTIRAHGQEVQAVKVLVLATGRYDRVAEVLLQEILKIPVGHGLHIDPRPAVRRDPPKEPSLGPNHAVQDLLARSMHQDHPGQIPLGPGADLDLCGQVLTGQGHGAGQQQEYEKNGHPAQDDGHGKSSFGFHLLSFRGDMLVQWLVANVVGNRAVRKAAHEPCPPACRGVFRIVRGVPISKVNHPVVRTLLRACTGRCLPPLLRSPGCPRAGERRIRPEWIFDPL